MKLNTALYKTILYTSSQASIMTDILTVNAITSGVDADTVSVMSEYDESAQVHAYFDKYSDDGRSVSQSTAVGGGKHRGFMPQDALHFQIRNKLNLYDDNGRKRNFAIQFFATRNNPGARIRNALTGFSEKHRVGSCNEDLYFKVTHATGEFDNRESLTLFYDSPEQYEKHWNMRLSQEDKEHWQSKYVAAQRRLTRE